MKKTILLSLLICLIAGPAFAATCPQSAIQIKDNAGNTLNMAISDDGTGSGNCIPTGQASAIPAGTNIIGAVSLAAAATNSATAAHTLSAANNNSTNIKASAGTLYSLVVITTTSTAGDLRLYDSASAPTCSSATGVVANYPVQANTTSPGFSVNYGPSGMQFVNGISFCLTGAFADNDNTNFVTGVAVNTTYK